MRRSGELPPFQRFFEEHRSDVWRLLVATLGRTEAEDCFQETFLAALDGYPRLSDARNLRAWVLTIAHRKAVDVHRRRRLEAVPAGDLPDRGQPPAGDGDPELWRAVRSLPAKQRAAIAHRFVADRAYKEIAGAMACSEEAARRSVHEGIKRLREVLSR